MTDGNRSLSYLLNTTTKTVFSTQDFNKLWQYNLYSSLIQRISYLKKIGKIKKIQKGLYSIKGREINEFELANKLRSPSYITFETVLYKEGLVFQWDQRITLASQESIEMKVLDYEVIFRQIKNSILLKKTGINKKDNYYIACKERAILDMLYINPHFTFDNLRPVDFSKLENLAQIYDRKSIFKLIKKLKTHA